MKKVRIVSCPVMKDGGPTRKGIPYIPEQEPVVDTMYNNGMMRGTIATSDAMGNPDTHRMVQNYPQQYTFTGREQIPQQFEHPPVGAIGSHYMGSYGNYAIPSIQQSGDSLRFNSNPRPTDKGAIRFNNEAEAEYFGEHYKEVAPMMRNWEQKNGGPVMNKKRVKIVSCPVMATGGISPQGEVLNQQTANSMANSSNPNYRDYGNMFAVDNMSGLYYKQDNPQEWQGFGNDANLVSNQRPYMGMEGSAPGYQAPTGNSRPQQDNWHTGENANYSIDSVRMIYGGQLPPSRSGQAGNSYSSGLNRTWLGAGSMIPGIPDDYRVGNTIEESEDPNIVIEKQEAVLGDFNQDGTPALLKANAGSHASGQDLPVKAPDGAFVFSDTKKLKIKSPEVLKAFGETKKKTPAAIAAKFPLQKFSAILADPKSDNLSRKTAKMMQGNYLKKLQSLANVQEQQKRDMGITPLSQHMRYGSIPIAKYGINDGDLPGYTVTGKRPEQIAGQSSGYNMFSTPIGQQNMNEYQVPSFRPADQIDPLSFSDPHRFGDQQIDKLPIFEPQMTPPTPNNMQARTDIPDVNFGNSTQPLKKQSKAFTTPDRLAMINSAYNLATLHKYLPYEPPVSAVVPDTVFLDPRRALAANAEQANSQGLLASNTGNSRTAQANFLNLQGQAGKQAADIVGQYQNQNISIANAANQGATGITNQMLEAQRNRLKSLHQGNTIADQQYDNAQREGRSDLLNQYTNAWKNRQGYNDLNQTNQLYQRDPRTGFMVFNSPEAKALYEKQLSGQPGGTEGGIAAHKKFYDEYLATYPGDIEGAKDYADTRLFGKRETRTTKQGNTTVKETTKGPHEFGGPVYVNALKKFCKV